MIPSSWLLTILTRRDLAPILTGTTVQEGINYRQVSATASTQTETMFIKLMGHDTLNAPAAGTAEERIAKVEISLVLDISGSMEDNNKLANLRNAANTVC